ncbi:MAG: GvpL/GvpF family gas vesicle protein [Chloroflexi bacterium]|nr:GvpL/GvpF family gas vesicle protein [Chloroflexota bacterium]
MENKYIYGIIDGARQIDFAITGLGDHGPVHVIANHGLGCMLSDFPDEEFAAMTKEELVRHLLVHQMVVEHAMRNGAVLPAKFGTILGTSQEVHDLLSQGHSQFINALSWAEDKVEVEVAATWDKELVLREISTEPKIAQAREDMANQYKHGEPSLEERVHLGQMVKASLDRRRASYREWMVNFLKPATMDVQPNHCLSDELVMNVAFLVQKTRLEGFDRRVKELNDLFQNQINFRIIGPLPPYSFATVEVTRLSQERIEEAKQLLNLGEVLSEYEVRKAYRHLAAENHPDRKPGDELAKIQFAKLRRASDLLIACCANLEGSWLINIRRQKTDEIQNLYSAEFEYALPKGSG